MSGASTTAPPGPTTPRCSGHARITPRPRRRRRGLWSGRPASLDARYELGLALLGAGRCPEAAQALGVVVEQDRSFDGDDALYALAKAQIGTGDLASARASLEELSTRRARPEILFDLATAQALTGDRESARRALQRILDEAELVPPYLQKNQRPWVKKARKGIAMLGKAG